MENDWDLMSVVRSCSKINGMSSAMNSPKLEPKISRNHEIVPTASFQKFPVNSITISGSEASFSASAKVLHLEAPVQRLQEQGLAPPTPTPTPTGYHTNEKEMKRRCKRQPIEKLTIIEVRNNYNDNWCWRKYGQKFNKHSPHRRHYYRCSTTKECQAKKYVEKSMLDPAMQKITYKGEHNHPIPTTNNSRAGMPRDSVLPTPMQNNTTVKEGCNENSSTLLNLDDLDFSWDPEMLSLLDDDYNDPKDDLKNTSTGAGSSAAHFSTNV